MFLFLATTTNQTSKGGTTMEIEDYEYDTLATSLESEFYRDHQTTINDIDLHLDQEGD